MNVDRTTVLLSIRPVYADRILAGTKTIEFRRKPLPDTVKTALIWKTRTAGGIVGKFDVTFVRETRASTWMWWAGEDPTIQPGIDAYSLYDYAGGPDASLWGIGIANVTSAQGVINPKTLHPALHRAPLSWRYAPEGWETRLEVPW